MKNIFKFFIDRPKVVNLILVLVIISGSVAFLNLKRNSVPNVDFKHMIVTTIYPGASPKDVEINISIPIEEQLQRVTGIREMDSFSTENFSMVVAEIDPNAKDIEKVKDDITKAVDRVVGLPELADKPMLTELKTDIFPVFEVALIGNHGISELELRKYAKNLEKKISLMNGVSGTEKIGYRKREIHVEVDLAKAGYNYVSLSEVMAAIQAANVRLSAGNINTDTTKRKVITHAEFDDLMDVKDVIVRSVFSGRRILVSDIAKVTDDFEERTKVVRANGEPCISIVVSKSEDADAVKVARRVGKMLEEYNKTLPEGVKAQIVKDYSVYVNAMLRTVVQNALIGFVLVLILLMVLLDPRVAFWTALGIPFSLLVTFYFMPIYNISVTNISLLAIIIVLGMLVDDAIVVAEHVYSFREKGMDPFEASLRGVSEIFWPVVATVTTTIAAFLPILLMGGIFGDFLRAIPIMITVVLTASLFESAFILPSHLAHIKLKKKDKSKIIVFFEKIYQKHLLKVLKYKYWVIAFFVGLFIFAVGFLMPMLGFELFPPIDNDILMIKIETPKGTPLAETERRVRKLEQIVEETIPEEILVSYVTTIGQKGTELWESVSSVTQSHLARIIINLSPNQTRKISAFAIKDDLMEKFEGLKEFTELDIVYAQGGPPVGSAVDVLFISNNDELLARFAGEFHAYISTNEAVYDINRSDETGINEINVKFDYGLMEELGITPASVAGVVRAAVDGNVVTSVRKGGEEIDYRVMVKDKFKGDPENIKKLTIPSKYGKLIRLGSFIKFEEKASPQAIWHREGDRNIRVWAELDNKKLNADQYNKALRAEFAPKVDQYPDLRMEFGGLERSTNESLTDFYNALFVALIVIFIILVLLFNSFTQPIIVMTAIPFGLIGVVFAFAFHGQTLTFLGLIGILGLAGVVVNNSLVMLKFLNEKEAQLCNQGEMLKIEHVVEAATRRFRPVILTTITTVAGLLPSLYGFIGGRLPMLFPLLLAICWGLVFSTFITLLLIPAIYLVERDFSCWFYSKFRKG